MTFILFLVIVLAIIAVYARYKQEQIVGLSKMQILEKHRNALFTYGVWLIFAIILFVVGYLLSVCLPMHETEEYEYWLFGTHKGTREVLTTSAWWSYILRGLGVLIGFPVLIGYLDRLNAVRRYKKMTQDEYAHLQQKTKADIKKQDEQAKQARKTRRMINNIGDFINGDN